MRPRLLSRAVGWCQDESLAEDLVQETLIELWRRRDDWPPNPEALAQTILHHKHIDHWRRRRHEVAMNTAQAERLPVDGTDRRDDMEVIALIMSQLPPLQQQIFRMKEVEGYAKEEIMHITGCTDESLRQNLSRARRRIREQYLKMTTP